MHYPLKVWMITAVGLFVCLSADITTAADPEPLAFPGAEGFAAHATGGRGGKVYHIINLNDEGPGSFRDAVSEGHRIIVFDVGGTIELKSRVRVAGDLTIAGQTAPGEGVATFGHSISFSDSKNVIVRYMRFRQGNAEGEEKKSAVNINSASDMIFDHVSVEWGRWDTVDMTECRDMTMQYCIIGQGVGPQRFGCLCESDNVTFTHNLWINNESRNPKAKGKIQYVNNVIYNWGHAGGLIEGHSEVDHYADLVGNYFIAGPDSSKDAIANGKLTDKIFSSGNYIDMNKNGRLDGTPATDADLGTVTVTKKPFATIQLDVDPAEVAFGKVVAEAGCSLHRDAVDRHLIDQVKSLGHEGKLIMEVSELGGPGRLKTVKMASPAPVDGIPLAWKSAHPAREDGYMPIEVYVNSLADGVHAP